MKMLQCIIVLVFCIMVTATLCSAEQADSQTPKAPSNDIVKTFQSHFSNGVYHFPKGTYKVTSNVRFMDPVVLDEGAVFDISDNVTVMFKSSFSAGRGKIFMGDGKVAGLKKMLPEWFGAVGDGVADDTAAIQKTLDSCGEDTGFAHGTAGAGHVILLTQSYLVSSLTVNSTYVTIHAENAWLIAKSTGSYPHLIKFTRHFCRITGTLYIEGNYNLGYGCMINVNARHFISQNVTIWRASLGWLFGNRKWATSGIPGEAELGDSEIEIFGGATVHCLRGVEAVGANTIILFNNALIYSYPWTLPKDDPRKAKWESADSTLVRSIGALIYFTGGGLANFTYKVPLIEVQPIRCTKPQYYSTYGGVYIANAHLEVGNLFATANPRKIPTQDYKGNKVKQNMASLLLTNCGGYMAGDQVPINTDPLFTGDIKIINCNFYGINRKSGYAKIGNPLARVVMDETSFNDDRVKGLDSVAGGTQLFTQRMIFEVKKTDQVVGKEGAVIVFATPTLTSDTGNFQSCYNAKTGVFTTPIGGLRNVRISAGTFSADGATTDITKMMILKNGKQICVHQSTGNSSQVDYTFDSLAAGDTIVIKQVGTESRTMSGDEMNYLKIIASRY